MFFCAATDVSMRHAERRGSAATRGTCTRGAAAQGHGLCGGASGARKPMQTESLHAEETGKVRRI
eukprot:CAMPEP_0117593676 /NCGR_PEP_ID=MMETSP0784-20121206/72769_1 /TAXON_ID=39447 /ORGANISM="" /LENGTH=64 /DNA_ID=CAMNT_0005395633 /DNA_START=34 /DNA_END=225 /DNA_ORIENTATION=-